MPYLHPARLRQQRQSVNPTHRRLADCSATDLIVLANREGRPVSELVANIKDQAAQSAAASARRWELATTAMLIFGAMIITYFTCIGIVATAIAQGWFA